MRLSENNMALGQFVTNIAGHVNTVWGMKQVDASLSEIANMFYLAELKAKMNAISSDSHQSQFIKLHHFKQERF